MPLRKDIHKVMVLGSGPIVIGQAAEFDYAGTQACRALREEGLEVVLVNSNPATIMTDKAMADKVYIEPMTVEAVQEIIKKEHPDSLLPNLGGQTGLNLAMELCENGFLEKMGVKLLGANPTTIAKAEDRQMFKDTMEKIGEPIIASKVVHSVEDAVDFTREIGLPVIIRPAYTLGGTGGGIAYTWEQLREIAASGIMYSRVDEILVEKCIAGWKEIEYEVMRDHKGNAITICNMENVDPVGVHTGDSVVVAPSQTLCDKEYQMLRTSALNIITELGIEGGCNVQYALNPESFEYAVIEVNPRSSRTVPYISKVTGVPMVDLATRCMFGEKLKDMGCGTGLHPESDHYAVKVPVFSFQKLRDLDTQLGPEMKSTGEVLGVAKTFREALLKGLTGAGFQMKKKGAVLISVRDSDKQEAIRIGERFEALGFDIYATSGTANVLNRHMVATNSIRNVDEPSPNIIDLIESGKIDYVVATSVKGRHPELGSVHIRRTAVERAIPCLTS